MARMRCGALVGVSLGGDWLNSGYTSSGCAWRLPGGKVGPVQGPRNSKRHTSVICIPHPRAVTIRRRGHESACCNEARVLDTLPLLRGYVNVAAATLLFSGDTELVRFQRQKIADSHFRR